MEMIVLWPDAAIEDLQKIHNFHIASNSLKVANNITKAIVETSILLENNPQIGQLEELLKHKIEEIRYLVEGNFKIVYYIDENQVIILTIFDCRQDPKKLKKIKG